MFYSLFITYLLSYGQASTEGVNIIYVLPGSKWGTQMDNVLVVAANYDTTNSITPGRQPTAKAER